MYAVEKKNEIEMKLKKEMSNIAELKAAANRSSVLANDVCSVLGACEQRLQQLETAVLPLYGDTARLQHIHYNMERTVKALDHVIDYYMVSRNLADLIQAGPYTSTAESLNIYLEAMPPLLVPSCSEFARLLVEARGRSEPTCGQAERRCLRDYHVSVNALDKLAEAQNYFNKNNPQSVELENINQLYNTGVFKLETAFEELLTRNTRPLSPTTLEEMITLEEDSSCSSASVSGSGCPSSAAAPLELLRALGGWLSAAGRPPVQPLLKARSHAATAAAKAFREAAKRPDVGRTKNLLNRSDSTSKKTSKIQKVLEKKANKIMMKASQTLEQSGLAIGRRSMNDSYTEEANEAADEHEAEIAGLMAACVCRLARHEQRYLLGLVPLPRLPALLAQVMKECFAILQQDVERACKASRRASGRNSGSAGACWALLARLQRLQPDVERALQPASPAPYTAIVSAATDSCLSSLEEWTEAVKVMNGAPVDGTVHQLCARTLKRAAATAQHLNTIGNALVNIPAYASAASQIPPHQDRNAALFAIYLRKVLAQVNLSLRNISEQYPDALKAIFLLNNTHYLLQGLQRTGLLDILMLAEPECEKTYRDMIQEHKNAYLQSWNKLLSHCVLDEPLPAKLRDKDRQVLKDKFAGFNREWEETTKAQRGYSVPDLELRESLKRENQQAILPTYTAFFDNYSSLPFSKNPDKYVKYNPVQIATQLDGYFDEAA